MACQAQIVALAPIAFLSLYRAVVLNHMRILITLQQRQFCQQITSD